MFPDALSAAPRPDAHIDAPDIDPIAPTGIKD